ncbi:hypothetical protein ACA910_003275 [Epithemia clementina (nom. ined.)]
MVGHWHLMTATFPAKLQLELYQLGFLPLSPLFGQQKQEQDHSQVMWVMTKGYQTGRSSKQDARISQRINIFVFVVTTIAIEIVVCCRELVRVAQLVLGGSLGQDGCSSIAMTSELIQLLCCQGGATTLAALEAGSSANVMVEQDTTSAWVNKEEQNNPEGWIETTCQIHPL